MLALLEPGIRMIEERVQKPCLGVVPYLRSLMLEEEDSLGLPVVTQTQWTPGIVLRQRERPAFACGRTCIAVSFKFHGLRFTAR